MLRWLAALLGLLVLAAPGTADAAKRKPAKLVVAAISNPPATTASGETFTVTGQVRNKGGKPGAALVTFELRNAFGTSYGVGTTSLSAIKPRRKKRFTATVGVPATSSRRACPTATSSLRACGRRVAARLAAGRPRSRRTCRA